jgi:hypothetical protein
VGSRGAEEQRSRGAEEKLIQKSKIPFGFDSFDSTGTAKTRTVSQNPKSKIKRQGRMENIYS